MRVLSTSLLIGICLLLAACGSNPRNSKNLPFRLIVFSEQGGIAGQQPQYGLSSDGYLLRTAVGAEEANILGKVAAEHLAEVASLVIKTKEVDSFRQEPANLNRQILIQTDQGNYSYYWNMPDDEVPLVIKELYQKLQMLPQSSLSAE